MPERIAFRMNLHPGQAAEYEKRHDEIFQELARALKDAGVSDYSIWLDPESNHLFGILTRSGIHCAPFVHRAIGTIDKGGTTRLSVGPLTTVDDMRFAADALAQLAASAVPA